MKCCIHVADHECCPCRVSNVHAFAARYGYLDSDSGNGVVTSNVYDFPTNRPIVTDLFSHRSTVPVDARGTRTSLM